MGRIRVLVVDDHRIFAEALATALSAESEIEVGAAGSASAAELALDRALAEGRPFDVLLVDADLGTAGPAVGPPRRPRPVVEAEPAPAVLRRSSGVVPAPRRPGSVLAPQRPPAASTPAVPQPAGPQPARPARTAGDPQPMDGIALLGRACHAYPGLRAVVLAAEDDPRQAVRALYAGAAGWVAKESSLTRLLAVLRGVLRGETHLPPALLTGVVRELTTARRDRTESERLVETLTPREKQVLRCMVAGLGRQAVAERLYLSPHTVRTHMQNVLGKLGVHSTLAAVALARRAGIGPGDAGAVPTPQEPQIG
ncbi:DNA-binding NarL/FixJ family response regulator [Kitasatospora sp. MAP12-15]|uniref:response regulator transcription factor n=1 Tax=unclassified Kitasatospora TaxID=2633591 RepID=UPI002475D6CD|nr:response regulator transcription factor [Kitasatospora sp. MAP12-44]MDH6112465.1 DNA-binding NarL/FixJ family response regulator [Kitasatospora sp. MAP12-44]